MMLLTEEPICDVHTKASEVRVNLHNTVSREFIVAMCHAKTIIVLYRPENNYSQNNRDIGKTSTYN